MPPRRDNGFAFPLELTPLIQQQNTLMQLLVQNQNQGNNNPPPPQHVDHLARFLSSNLRTNPLNVFSMNNPRSWVSGRLSTRSILPKSSILLCDFDAGAAPGRGGHMKPNSTARGSGTIPRSDLRRGPGHKGGAD